MNKEINCNPELVDGKKCDYLDFVYRLINQTRVKEDNIERSVAVEVALHLRVERCTNAPELGNLIYSTTLLPGEKVRIYTQDRKSRFPSDAGSQLSCRHEQSSEEQYYINSFESLMSDLESRDQSSSSSTISGSSSTGASTSGISGTLFNGPSVSVSGSFNSASTRDFISELNVHAQSCHNRAVHVTPEANATQISEIQTRQYGEGKSEKHFESSARIYQNKNECHSVSYLFYQVNKRQTTRFTIMAIKTRVIDPIAKSDVVNHPLVADRKLTTIPTVVQAMMLQTSMSWQTWYSPQLTYWVLMKILALH